MTNKLPSLPRKLYILSNLDRGTSATTGECVEAVAKSFSKDLIWNDFGAVTQEICKAFQSKKISEIQKCIRENHRLLVKIGVVPLKVQSFISDIEKRGAAAKICWAGSISSEKSGIVLIIADSSESVQQICEKYGYKISPVKSEERGLHIV